MYLTKVETVSIYDRNTNIDLFLTSEHPAPAPCGLQHGKVITLRTITSVVNLMTITHVHFGGCL